MFGYIRPRRDDLRVREDAQYRAAYCGLCHALGRRCGFAARFLVSYDMTFLYLLLQSPEQWTQCERQRCPAHIGRKNCQPETEAMALAADYSVLLYVWKLRDEVKDESFARRVAARLALGLLHRSYRKAAARHGEIDRRIAAKLNRLAELEQQNTDKLDAVADAFAQILVLFGGTLPNPRAAEQMLYHIGRYIYLTDALDDLAEDDKKDRYNPLRRRFDVRNGALNEKDKQYFLSLIHGSIGMAASALELMEFRSGGEIIKNIVYQGMPAVLQAVAAGTFHNTKEKD